MIAETTPNRRRFTGNFRALLNHDNQNPHVRYAKRMAKKQLKAYLRGDQNYTVSILNQFGFTDRKLFPTPISWA